MPPPYSQKRWRSAVVTAVTAIRAPAVSRGAIPKIKANGPNTLVRTQPVATAPGEGRPVAASETAKPEILESLARPEGRKHPASRMRPSRSDPFSKRLLTGAPPRSLECGQKTAAEKSAIRLNDGLSGVLRSAARRAHRVTTTFVPTFTR